MSQNIIYKTESYRIVGAAFEVHNTLGCGFSEPVYQDALELEFKVRRIPYEREKVFNISYKGVKLDKTFRVDFVCYGKIIVELKALSQIIDDNVSQVLNYLKASNLELGILINFGTASLEHERILPLYRWSSSKVDL